MGHTVGIMSHCFHFYWNRSRLPSWRPGRTKGCVDTPASAAAPLRGDLKRLSEPPSTCPTRVSPTTAKAVHCSILSFVELAWNQQLCLHSLDKTGLGPAQVPSALKEPKVHGGRELPGLGPPRAGGTSSATKTFSTQTSSMKPNGFSDPHVLADGICCDGS